MNPYKFSEDEGEPLLVGELLWKPSDSDEFAGIIQLAKIGFDEESEDGEKRFLRCLRKHFLKKQ